MKSMLKYLHGYRKESVIAPLFKMLEAFFDLLTPLVMADIINVGVAGGDMSYIWKRCALLVLLGIVGLTCSITAQYFSSKAAVGYATGLRHALMGHIQTLGFAELDDLGGSTLITRMTSDINQIQNGLNLFLRLFMRSPFVVIGGVVMAFIVDRRAAVIFVITVPVLAVIVFGIMLATMPMYRNVQNHLDSVTGLTRENLSGVRVVRAFNMEQTETDRFHAANGLLKQMQISVGRFSSLMNPLTFAVVNIAIIAILRTGALQINAGSMRSGDVIALVSYMTQILVELVKLANLIIQMTKTLACAERVRVVLDRKPEMVFPETPTLAGGSSGGSSDGSSDRSTVGSLDSSTAVSADRTAPDAYADAVYFDHVSLRYANAGDESLTDITFSARPGQTIGIIGGTGSGKSSLVNLIPRFYDATSGSIRIMGQKITDLSREQIRGSVGMVMQRPQLFAGTIASNLRWGNADADDEELWQALETAQAAEFVRSKPLGLEEPVEQGGRNLSGGQRQRLTIARALVRKPSILILDDSASALDYATDAALRKAIAALPGSMTTFIVSQRTASLMHADQIIVLEDGKMAGIGTHKQLLESCSVYREIYDSQFGKEGEPHAEDR